MREVAHGDLALFLHGGEEGPLVVDLEGEDAVLVGRAEGGAEDGAVGRRGCWVQRDAEEGGEHAEFELQGVVGGESEGRPVVVGVGGDFDRVGLRGLSAWV